MKVLKAIVDELPKSCRACHYMNVNGFCLQARIDIDDIYIRPDWCPLEKQKELPKYKVVNGEYDKSGGTIPSIESEEVEG